MAGRDSAAPGRGMTAADRFVEDNPVVSDGGVSTSPDALQVLREDGIDAWTQWCADQGADSDAEESAPAEEAEGDPKGREWPGWAHDEALTDHYADLLAAMLQDELGDLDQLAAAWLASPQARDAVAKKPAEESVTEDAATVALIAVIAAAALLWLLTRRKKAKKAAAAILRDAGTEGYFLGDRSARAVVTLDPDGVWDGWTPGDPEAARKILGKDGRGEGLRRWLARDDSTSTVDPADPLFEQIAKALAAAVAAGDTPATLAKRLEQITGNKAWAKIAAQMEIARAQGEATIDRYTDAGIARHEWLDAGLDPLDRVRVCPICTANAAAGPVEVGKPFPSGHLTVPAHPRCRCATMPVIEVDDETIESVTAVDITEADATAAQDDDELDEARTQLRAYWVAGAGRKRWSTWRELYAHLRKHIEDEDELKRTVSRWFILRHGYAAGSARNTHD